jgi:ectoine hydroxylase-related dioxygenase (phytanoyl-CoA dioxygenase family)
MVFRAFSLFFLFYFMPADLLAFPSLYETISVDPETIRSFRENGHTLTRHILSAEEVAVYRRAILDAAGRFNTENRKLEDRDTYGKAFLQIMNLWEVDEAVKKFTLAKRFGKIAADLMGVKNVRIYHDQALFKEPGGGPTPWHQDQYYWPVDTNNTVTLWMPLVDITEEMGMLTFASGSHLSGLAGNIAISDDSEVLLDQYVLDKKFKISRPKFMNAGDATWHYGLTLHKALGNNSQTMREVMTIIYIADGTHVTIPGNENQEKDRQRWFQGLSPGDLATSKLNPSVL